jgi:type II secretory pathway pseudopilin PulG
MKKNQNRQYTLAKVLAGVGAAALLGSAAAAASAWLRGRRAEQKPQPRPVQRKPRKRSRGFSIAEVLLVVGIIAILAGVTTVSVFHYQRDSHRLEMDSVAREIFVAAQNHLIEAKGQGYLGKISNVTGTEWAEGEDWRGLPENNSEGNPTGIYYFVVDFRDTAGAYESPDSEKARNTLLSLMLPSASVEENIRLGGSYIIRYDPESAAILDVFYAEKGGKAFGHTFSADEYEVVRALAGDSAQQKAARRNVSRFSNAVVGWYGGTELAGNPETKPIELKKPQIILHNEDTLWLEVRDYNTLAAVQELGGGDKAGDIVSALQRKVIVTGELSKTSLPKFEGMTTGTDGTDEYGAYNGYRFTLDDITEAGKHFKEQFDTLFPG